MHVLLQWRYLKKMNGLTSRNGRQLYIVNLITCLLFFIIFSSRLSLLLAFPLLPALCSCYSLLHVFPRLPPNSGPQSRKVLSEEEATTALERAYEQFGDAGLNLNEAIAKVDKMLDCLDVRVCVLYTLFLP